MYLIDFLRGFPNLESAKEWVSFEYRLLCSGALYNANVRTFDWRKSDVTRILLESPFRLIVCSRPLDDYPQEFALYFSSPLIIEKKGQTSSMFHPDDDIVRDLAALLTLLYRRLITVTAKVRVVNPNMPAIFQDCPIGFTKSLSRIHWEYKLPIFANYSDGTVKITDYNPPPIGIDPERLKKMLLTISRHPFAESIILSSRLYSLALQQLEHDIDIAYQLLIATVETIANKTFSTYTPTNEQMAETKKPVAKLAKEFGLSDDQANQLAIKACKGIPWSLRKFTKFLLDNTADELWKEEDDLFKVPAEILPTRENYETVLKDIYRTRGKLSHAGHSFPPSSTIGLGPTFPSKVFRNFDFFSKPFPPIVWFERIVNHAINTFLKSLLVSDIDEKPTTNTHVDR